VNNNESDLHTNKQHLSIKKSQWKDKKFLKLNKKSIYTLLINIIRTWQIYSQISKYVVH
jgi:hypothetical protein